MAEHCFICPDLADALFTWVNAPGEGKGANVQGGPMCDGCMATMWHKLASFPITRETVTIRPIRRD